VSVSDADGQMRAENRYQNRCRSAHTRLVNPSDSHPRLPASSLLMQAGRGVGEPRAVAVPLDHGQRAQRRPPLRPGTLQSIASASCDLLTPIPPLPAPFHFIRRKIALKIQSVELSWEELRHVIVGYDPTHQHTRRPSACPSLLSPAHLPLSLPRLHMCLSWVAGTGSSSSGKSFASARTRGTRGPLCGPPTTPFSSPAPSRSRLRLLLGLGLGPGLLPGLGLRRRRVGGQKALGKALCLQSPLRQACVWTDVSACDDIAWSIYSWVCWCG